MRGRRALAVAAASLAVVTSTGVPAAVAGPFDRCDPEPRGIVRRTEPWGQRRLDFQKAWSFTTGAGILVGEIDSGVDTTHPQLEGQVFEPVDLTNTRLLDCTGHGTRVAGIIVGRDLGEQGIVFTGVAPGAKLLSIKQTDTEQNDPNGVSRLADGIRLATDRGVKVLNISISADRDLPVLRDAVRYAQQRDVLIVAAAGNENAGGGGQKPAQYPANYTGVVGVGAINEKGERADFSVTATRVSVAAPGSQIISTAAGPQHGYTVEDGTSFAAPFVTGVAALVRAYHPELNYQEVKHRLEATADHTTDPALGAGVVNPLQAVTAVLPEENATSTAPPVPKPLPPLQSIPVPDNHTRNLALVLAAGGAGVSGLVLVGAVVVPRGRRRRWRPGRRPPAREPDRPEALLR